MTTNTIDSYLTHLSYGAQGFVMSGGNALLIATIFYQSELRQRKEMLLISGLAAADFIFGFGSFLTFVYRVFLLATGLQNEDYTAFKCIILPPFFFVHLGLILVAIMNLFVSIDRYIAVAYPTKYQVMNPAKIKVMLLLVALIGIFACGIMFSATYFDMPPNNMTLLCYKSFLPSWYYVGEYVFIAVVGGAAVAIYVVVFVTYKARTNSQLTSTNRHAATDRYARTQRRLTVTLGIINVGTLIFFVAPASALAALIGFKIPFSVNLGSWLGTLLRVSPIVNIAVYLSRQKEIRSGMWRLLTCKICRKQTQVTFIKQRNTTLVRSEVNR